MDHHLERTIRITACGCSDRGRVRSENQDHFLIADLGHPAAAGGLLIRRDTAPDHTLDREQAPRNHVLTLGPDGALALVADGMGGAAGGELASRLATTSIYEALPAPDDASAATTHPHFAQRLRHAVEYANSQLFRISERDPRLFGMGTTATVAAIQGDTLYLAQIGDSRAYLVRNGTAHQLTHDQSRVQALVDAGILTPEEAAQSSERHIILQALGPEPRVDVDLTRQQLRRGDVVVLSTDGLHGVVTPAEIAALAAPQQTGAGAGHATPPDPAAACSALVQLGNNRGGPDNITVVIMHIGGDDLPEPRDDDVITRQEVP